MIRLHSTFVLVVLEGRLLGTVHANRRLLSNRLPKKSSHESFLKRDHTDLLIKTLVAICW